MGDNMANAAQIDFWNGDAGSGWVRNQEQLDSMLAPLGEAGIESLLAETGLRVLDIGCGCGASSVSLARLGCHVTGVDISAPMLAMARSRIMGDDIEINFVQQDAATSSFDGNYDRVFSRFGVMFFDDPVSAFSNIHSALRDTGKLAFVCWRAVQENAWMREPVSIMMKYVRPAADEAVVSKPDPHAPGPFAFADEDRVRDILTSAGFSNIRLQSLDSAIQIGRGSAQDALHFIEEIGPASRLMSEQTEDSKALIRTDLLQLMEENRSDGQVTMGAACWIVTADA
jgi:ubiquinone/menaquinone biosynthesis C-methylase UbiE